MFALLGLMGLFSASVGAAYGAWWLVALGVATVTGAIACLRATAQGRNPRWFHAPLDRWWPPR